MTKEPVLLVLDKQRLVAAGTALAGGIAAWAPFMIANPATLTSNAPCRSGIALARPVVPAECRMMNTSSRPISGSGSSSGKDASQSS